MSLFVGKSQLMHLLSCSSHYAQSCVLDMSSSASLITEHCRLIHAKGMESDSLSCWVAEQDSDHGSSGGGLQNSR